MIRYLNDGGFGVVFEAKNKLDDCRYAIKRITLPKKEEARNRVMQEVKTLANLKHHNIVRYFQSWVEDPPSDWQEEEDKKWLPVWLQSNHDGNDESTEEDDKVYLYIQMELCRKETLRHWLLKSEMERRIYNIYSIFHQIVDAVGYLHYEGLIHRDLKPENIFFSQEGQIKIGDFGLADITNMITKRGDKTGLPSCARHTQQDGTISYMSPEQKDGLPYNHKVDIYSLGLIFFELLVPFASLHEMEKPFTSLRNGVYPDKFAEKHRKEYSLLRRMLSATPEERPFIEDVKEKLNEISMRCDSTKTVIGSVTLWDLLRAKRWHL